MTTMSLPGPLQAWQPYLSWFTPELAAPLSEMLRRMHPLLGRFQGHRQGGVPEPDGVEDLRRRGPYERLLSTEWLLATELPDEFLRRAAGGEHLFLAPRLRARQADRLIVALFDAGPWQLGAPRLAQLALWILLARRAAEAGGELRWGTLQCPGQLKAAGTPEDLKLMLRARSFDSAGVDQWQQWSEWLAEHASGVGECWLVGHAVDVVRQRPDAPTHAVRLRTSLDGESLDVTLRAGSAPRRMALPLPAPRPAAQLLMGRFQNEAPVHANRQYSERLSLRDAPIISSSGALVAVPLLEGHGAMVFRIAGHHDRKHNKPGRQQWGANAEPLAAAFRGKTFGAVLSLPETLHFWQMAGLGVRRRPPREDFEAPPGRGSLLPCTWQRHGQNTRLYVVDAAGRLVYWVSPNTANDPKGETRGPMLMDAHVRCLAPVDESRIVYACVEDGSLWVRFASTSGRENTSFRLLFGLEFLPKVLLAGGARWARHFGGCAVRVSDVSETKSQETWRVYEEAASEELPHEDWECKLAPGARGIGLVRQPYTGRYALVIQAANGTDFVLQSRDGVEPMYTAPAAVERASVCPSSGLVAMLTRDRDLHVYSTADMSMRLVVHSAGGETRS
jgi:hypothetical protein